MESIYTLSLTDRVSSKMRTITGTTDTVINRFEEMKGKMKSLNGLSKDFGGSISTLRSRIDLLQAERDIINPKNITTIRQYNNEIAKLNKQVDKLTSTRGGLRDKISEFTSAIPGMGGMALGAGAGALMGIGSAFKYEENLAKVNVTAQLDPKGLAQLEKQIKSISEDNKASVLQAPIAFERIISQTNDVVMSLDILNSVQKGSKAGFTDMNTVADALAQTMSIVGKENMNASAVLDTLFAAKRVGAGNFADFSRYIPGLTAGAKTLGVSFQDVAGVFAYMTGMGNSAEKSAVYIENAFSSLGKSDIQEGMKKFGVHIFDSEGKMQSLTSIAAELNGILAGKSDKQKSSILEQIGLRDKEARSAFAILTSNLPKLTESISATNNSLGETENALALANNPMMRAIELWNQFQNLGQTIGSVIMPVIGVAMTVVGFGLSMINGVLSTVIDGFKDGNPLIIVSTSLLGLWAIAINAAAIKTTALAIKTNVVTAAQWAYNTALDANPIGLFIAGVAALTIVFVSAYQKCGRFRGAIYGAWEAVKGFAIIIKEYVIDRITGFLGGISALGKSLVALFKGDFSTAAKLAAEGGSKIFGVSDAKNAMSKAKELGGKVGKAYQKGVAEIAKKKEAQNNPLSSGASDSYLGGGSGSTPITASLATGMGGAGNMTNYKGSTVYNAIAARMRRVALPAMTAASIALTPQIAVANGGSSSSAGSAAQVQSSRGRNVNIEKIEINVASLDGKGKDEIVRILQDALMEVLNGD